MKRCPEIFLFLNGMMATFIGTRKPQTCLMLIDSRSRRKHGKNLPSKTTTLVVQSGRRALESDEKREVEEEK